MLAPRGLKNCAIPLNKDLKVSHAFAYLIRGFGLKKSSGIHLLRFSANTLCHWSYFKISRNPKRREKRGEGRKKGEKGKKGEKKKKGGKKEK